MRVVLDTNILVRAVIMPHGTVGPVLLRLRNGDYSLLYSQSLLEELIEVLLRPRIYRKYGLSQEDIKTVVSLILLRGEEVTPQESTNICRDPKDDKFLEVAVSGMADVIVSGDEDLLTLSPFRAIQIVPPRAFLQMLDVDRLDNEI
jgi:putative PIN family toxin of toxin-antitoxin system